MKKSLFIIILLLIASLLNPERSLDYLNNILSLHDESLLKDDPLYYSIYQKIESSIRANEKLIGNNRDMISFMKFQAGLIYYSIDSLQKIRGLIIKKSNPIFNNEDREIIDNEISGYYDMILKQLSDTDFNKIKVFNDLFNSKEIEEYFNKNKYYELNNVDKLLKYFSDELSRINANINLIERINSSKAKSKENYIEIDNNLGAYNLNQILFLKNLFLLEDSD